MTNRYRDTQQISPRPWRVHEEGGEVCFILDANDDEVIVCDTGFYPPNLVTAEFICKCVNERKD